MKKILALSTLFVLAAACASQPRQPSSQSSASAPEQIAYGAEVYSNHCAGCHGKAGQGTRRGPVLVGSGAFPLLPRPEQQRRAHFRSALDIAKFATTSMPPSADDRAELTEQDYWAVLAFALSANGVELSEPVNAANAGAIVLHP